MNFSVVSKVHEGACPSAIPLGGEELGTVRGKASRCTHEKSGNTIGKNGKNSGCVEPSRGE